MLIFPAILITFSFALLFLCIRNMIRNDKVYEFRGTLIQMAHNYNMRHLIELVHGEVKDAHNWFTDKHSYNAMLNSRKPLTLEAWYTEEEIAKIKS